MNRNNKIRVFIMKKFTELNLEQTRELNDGAKNATLMSVTGACSGNRCGAVSTFSVNGQRITFIHLGRCCGRINWGF
jgi:hypothetical protein